ncbi:MAG: hypothetical protein KAY24_17615 [Candidatus Eisenbacteria sp.]|nr:hypothetical protein [Candidatus Eisenbacteria bacterium]
MKVRATVPEQGETIGAHLSTDHAVSSYGKAVLVLDNGQPLGIMVA